MADVNDKERAEKVAAGRKRLDQYKKQKEKGKRSGGSKKSDEPQDFKEEPTIAAAAEPGPDDIEQETDAKAATVDETANTAAAAGHDEGMQNQQPEVACDTVNKPMHHRQPSLSVQSKMRSSSFRRGSMSQGPLSPSVNGSKSPDLPALSPDGDSVNAIYRKQAARLDELEKDNRRFAKEVQDAERKWRQTEEELEELREASGDVAALKDRAKRADGQVEEFNKMKSENTSLQRQNSQLQSQSSKRHVSSPSQVNTSGSPLSSLQAQLDSKSSTIESMEMEISNLRAQNEKDASSTSGHAEQVSALEDKLERADRTAGAAQRELLDLKKNLGRASEKAVKEGSERSSAETKIRSLSRESEDSKKAHEESLKRVETLDKKLTTLTSMHKEADSRRQAGEKDREKLEKETADMKRRLAGLENENMRLKEERERARKKEVSGADDEGVDELEDEEKIKLKSKIRDLEGEVHELRRGIWRDKRKELGSVEGGDGPTSPGSKFDDIDLIGGPSAYRTQSSTGRSSGFSNVLSSGISAFTGGGNQESLDDDEDFDENAFRLAQEEEGRKRIERVKENKRRLKDWEGWRMDIVDVRVSGGGAGEIFDV